MSPWRSLQPPIAEPFVVVDRCVVDVVRVEGPGAEDYLEGQLSQNVSSMGVGETRRSFLLQPQGHVVGWFRIVRTGPEAFALVADDGAGEAIVARLERFKLGTKAEISNRPSSILSVRASEPEALEEMGPAVVDGELSAVPLEWPALTGVDIFGDPPTALAEQADSGLIGALRVGAGIPSLPEFDEKTIPAELGVVDMSADFDKGCYTGQELVARIDSRGNNTPRQIRVLSGTGAAPAAGDEVTNAGEVAGVITSVATLSTGWLALGSIRRTSLDVAKLAVGGHTAEVESAF